MEGKRVTISSKFYSGVAVLAVALALTYVPSVLADPVTTDDGAKVAGKGAEFDPDAGKWFLASGDPTYHIKSDGKIDFLTYRGFQRYHSECHVCHGPEGVGSSYAPSLVDSLKTMSYSDFVAVVASGRIRDVAGTEFVMPALGDNKNVMCYLDGIYTYLKARSDGILPRGRPQSKDPKPEALGEAENACLQG